MEHEDKTKIRELEEILEVTRSQLAEECRLRGTATAEAERLRRDLKNTADVLAICRNNLEATLEERNQRASLKCELHKAQGDLEEVRGLLKHVKFERNKAHEGCRELRSQLEEAERRETELRNVLTLRTSERDDARSIVASLEGELEEASRFDPKDERIAELAAELAKNERESAELRQKLNSIQSRAADHLLDGLRRLVHAKQCESTAEAVRRRIGELVEFHHEARKESARAQLELANARKEINRALACLGAAEGESLVEAIERLTVKLADARDDRERLQLAFDTARSGQDYLDKERKRVEAMLDALEKRVEEQQTTMVAALNERDAAVKQCKDAKHDRDVAFKERRRASELLDQLSVTQCMEAARVDRMDKVPSVIKALERDFYAARDRIDLMEKAIDSCATNLAFGIAPSTFRDKGKESELDYLRRVIELTLSENARLRGLLKSAAETSKVRRKDQTSERKVDSLVFVASPLSGDVQRNVAYAKRAMLDSLKKGEAPYLPHLLYPQVLDDSDPGERDQGMHAARCWLARSSRLVVYTDLGISKGMRSEIDAAEAFGVPVVYRQIGKGKASSFVMSEKNKAAFRDLGKRFAEANRKITEAFSEFGAAIREGADE